MNIPIDIQIDPLSLHDALPIFNNPREHSSEQITQIGASMCEFGWTNPILLGPDDYIIADHARLLAERYEVQSDVHVVWLRHLSDNQCRALVIADNQLAITGASW